MLYNRIFSGVDSRIMIGMDADSVVYRKLMMFFSHDDVPMMVSSESDSESDVSTTLDFINFVFYVSINDFDFLFI